MKSGETDFFRIEQTNVVPRTGSILISEPFSRDAYFKRSIVLLTLNDEEGSVGFILNKEVEMSMQDLFGEDIDMDVSVSIGGPVSIDRVDYIHTLGDKIPESKHVVGDIYWGGNFEVMISLLKAGIVSENQIRFFLGYSGWNKGQLENEIDHDYWLVADGDPHTIMLSDKDYWKNTLKKMGKRYSVWLNLPEDPQFN
ncbi:MAG: YqgE/AlgH family protein [Chloroflexia bacterium]|nr:YqgE/AlgH family protein [Chloroflexia bacterium]